jgi:hypothetical protein
MTSATMSTGRWQRKRILISFKLILQTKAEIEHITMYPKGEY